MHEVTSGGEGDFLMRRFWRGRVASAALSIAILTIVVPVLAGCGPGDTAQRSGSTIGERAGVATGWQTLWESDADQNADYAGVQSTGATWTTLDIDWNHIQDNGPNTWKWNLATDRALLAASAHHLQVIGIAGYSPPWARRADCPPGELHCFPQNASDYGRFLGAAAARYGSRATDPRLRGTVEVWSLWNEPNHRPYSMPKPDPVKYAAMVKSAYAAIKAADPEATVLTGGTAPAPDAADGTDYQQTTWLQMLYDNGAAGSFDGVANHPYAYPFSPLTDKEWNAYRQTEYLHDIMAAHGDAAKKVWGTEMGAPTGTQAKDVTESEQAQHVRDYFTGWWNGRFRSFTGPLIWFRLRDEGTNPADQNFGLLHRDRSEKPAFAAFRAVMGEPAG
jgi:hypothetical protein